MNWTFAATSLGARMPGCQDAWVPGCLGARMPGLSPFVQQSSTQATLDIGALFDRVFSDDQEGIMCIQRCLPVVCDSHRQAGPD